MNDRLNKTLIGSIVFLDVIGYSQKPVAEQIKCKTQLNKLIGDAVESVAEHDRIIIDTGDGVAITLLGSPEDALRIAVGIRDRIAGVGLVPEDLPFHVRIGINLGPVQVVRDINGQFNVIGDGINVAQRVMNFAEPDQILVSRSYYEVASRLTREIEEMLAYSGIKHDKHIRGHEIYIVRSPEAFTHHSPAARKKLSLRSELLIIAGLVLAAGVLVVMMQSGQSQPVPEAVAATEEQMETEPPAPEPVSDIPAEKKKPRRTKAEHRQAINQSIACSDAQRSMNQCR